MEKIDNFTYQNGDILVEFFETEQGSEKYFFTIKNTKTGEFLEELAKSFKTQKVKEKDIFYAARGIFEKIALENGKEVKDHNDQKPIKISFSTAQKGGGDEDYWLRLNIIHKKGSFIKSFSFPIGEDEPNSSYDAWLHIFLFSRKKGEEYSDFLLENFNIDLPEILKELSLCIETNLITFGEYELSEKLNKSLTDLSKKFVFE